MKHSTINCFFGKFQKTEFTFLGLGGNHYIQIFTLPLDFISNTMSYSSDDGSWHIEQHLKRRIKPVNNFRRVILKHTKIF